LLSALGLLCAAGLLAAAPVASAKEIVIGSSVIAHTVDPMGHNSNVNQRISNNLVESLIEFNESTGEITPLLAESWTVVDDRTIEFKLRQGVTCHNGEVFDAADVVFSFGPERFNGPDAPGWNAARGYLQTIERVEAIDSHNLRIVSKIPDPLMLPRLGAWMSQVICEDAYRAAADWETWGRAVVGTGPYMIGEFKPGESIRLVRFDGYWGDKAPVDAVVFKKVPEMAARVSGLLSGELDMVTELVPDQFATVEGSGKAKIVGGPINNIRALLYDQANPIFKDPRVRQALGYAIDRQLIVDTLYGGRTAVPKGHQMELFDELYIADFDNIGYDPDKARQLLADAGYKGEEINYWYLNDYYTAEIATAQILQQMWRDVGLNVTIGMKEDSSSIYTADKHLPDRGIFNISNTAYWHDPAGMLWHLYGSGGPVQTSYGSWSNERFNAIGGNLLSVDLAMRQATFREMLQIYEYDDPPGTYLHYLTFFYGLRNGIEWTPSRTAFMDLRAANLKVD